jgi:hypothetical protein
MLHVCVQRFDVTGDRGNILGSERGLHSLRDVSFVIINILEGQKLICYILLFNISINILALRLYIRSLRNINIRTRFSSMFSSVNQIYMPRII